MDYYRIVIADDHYVVRTSLRMLLEAEPGIEVVAEAWDVPSTIRCMRGYRPDVLLLDLNMPGESSVAALARIVEEFPDTAVLALTMRGKSEVAREALRRGARGVVLKESADTELVAAVRGLADDDGAVTTALGSELTLGRTASGEPGDGLTQREIEILRLVARGHATSEIAEHLALSQRTVETHRARMQRKLGRSTRAELVRYALDRGLLGAGRP
ncbi:MAG TPA: response regulator transcription factor [Conexibacter sp.]|nr:response regulator transcription factor [Conexibacter sp.]